MTSLNIGDRGTYTFEYLDNQGRPITPPPTLDGPPAWTHSSTTVATLTPSADRSSAGLQATAAGSDTVNLQVAVKGTNYTDSDAVTVAPANPKLASIKLKFTLDAGTQPPPGGGGGGALPAGVTLQAIDGETMSGTTMSHSFYTGRNLTTLTNNRPSGFPNWDDPAFFPVDAFYGLYGNNAANFTTYLDLGFSGSNMVTGGMDFNTMSGLQLWGTTCKPDYDTGTVPIGNWHVGWHTDEHNPSGDISIVPNNLQDHKLWDLVYTRNGLVFGGISANGDLWTFIGPDSAKNFGTPNGTKRGVDNYGVDLYFFAIAEDTAYGQPYASGLFQVPMQTVGPGCSRDQCARGSHYGNMIDCHRAVANGSNINPTQDGSKTAGTSGAPATVPLLPYIETTTGKWTSMQVAITGPQLNWATWSSIIHGARRINYFTDFGVPADYSGSNGPGSLLYTSTKNCIGLIQNLAAVLNSPFALSYVSATPHGYAFPVYEADWLNGGIETMAKWYQGGSYTPASGPLSGIAIGDGFYIFACTRYGEANAAVTATFTVNDPNAARVNVLGENRSITISGGRFSDNFANAAAVHIYQVV